MSHSRRECATLSLEQKRELVARLLREKASPCRDGAGSRPSPDRNAGRTGPEAVAVTCRRRVAHLC